FTSDINHLFYIFPNPTPHATHPIPSTPHPSHFLSLLNSPKLQDNGLTDDCTKDLVSALSTNHSLMELYLDNNKLGDLGMKRLSGALRKPECKIQKLELESNGLTGNGIKSLVSALSTNRSLTELHLDCNKLKDSGMKQLSDALRKPECKLERLWYVTRYEIVSVTTCYIPSILFSDYSYYYLKILVISEPAVYSNLYCVQMILLRESPSHTDIAMVCNLTRSSACVFLLITVISPSLISRLGHNNLTAKCTEDLASALSKNCSLTELHLHNNKLADSGVKRLLVALRDSDKIQQPW
uniref:Uncharacterized protein n=1 Tax=Callorhinchus milii TaxID=7868 RepID=A0A4W3HKU5_CALMI